MYGRHPTKPTQSCADLSQPGISYFNEVYQTTTLSLNVNSLANLNSPIGLLYVPTLNSTDPCVNASAPYVPQNVTRVPNLPNALRLAIAPWLSPQCVYSYLDVANHDGAQSIIFFLPGQGTAAPPSSSDNAWNIGDNGNWKNAFPFSAFAVSTSVGENLMQELVQYSGNMSSVPNGALLETMYEPHGFIRIAAQISLNLTSGLPSLWVFLVIIVVVLIVVVTIVSTLMHFLQKRRRRLLRRRVERGEVDLETIGVKRLMVPSEVLAKMPTYIYEEKVPSTPVAASIVTQDSISPKMPAVETVTQKSTAVESKVVDTEQIVGLASTTTTSAIPNQFEQPTCAICLDDFVAGESRVRQLPCDHIFHPDCVDTFLTQNSSLCPLCKKSCLPVGYCPPVVTNAMVARERRIRRQREHEEAMLEAQNNPNAPQPRGVRAWLSRHNARDIALNNTTADWLVEGTNRQSRTERRSRVEPQPMDPEQRREWLRRRMSTLVGPSAAPRDPDQEVQARPAWSRAIRRVFPSS